MLRRIGLILEAACTQDVHGCEGREKGGHIVERGKWFCGDMQIESIDGEVPLRRRR